MRKSGNGQARVSPVIRSRRPLSSWPSWREPTRQSSTAPHWSLNAIEPTDTTTTTKSLPASSPSTRSMLSPKRNTMPIVELGHVGLFTDDLANLSDFYCEVLGLFHTDGSVDAGIIFLSSRPSFEHHELVLVQRRDGEGPKGRVNQVSWRGDTLAGLLTVRPKNLRSGAASQQQR